MKLLLDENLSPKLVKRLSDLFALISTEDVQLRRASDAAVWSYARSNGFQAIITGDRDFIRIADEQGTPPKVIRIANCNVRLAAIEALLRREAIRIHEFLTSDKSVLQIKF